jgi:Uma2 family endonuclease
MTTVQLNRHKISVSDYHRMAASGIFMEDDRIELLNGEMIEMSPIGPSHTAHVKAINRVLSKLLEGQAIIGVQDPIVLDNLSEPVPDISVLKWRDDDYLLVHPTPKEVFLVIEVADSSINIDRSIKLPIYAAAGIADYWIINLPEKKIELYSNPLGAVYQSILEATIDDEVTLPVFNLNILVKALLK